MAGRLRQVIALSVLAAGLCAGGAQALQIEGLNPLEPLSAALAGAAAHDGQLELKLADGRTLGVGDWPAFLPQRFGPQQVDASRRLRPAGPSDQLSFSRAGESGPWLIVGSGARRGATLVGAWQLQLNGHLWSISDGATEKALGVDPRQAAPVQVMVENQRWCLYLLQTQLPKTRAGVVAEDEPQISWAGWRLEGNRKRCPAAR
jgi:hypothetical protein